ncbi:hypothetical protein BS639_11010 [Rouxiella silvae]|uniref:DUF4760 domain-containing protein n=1 Tax=Rouxiella silvae TaxID=1646373 RepID=A0ABX3U0U7_9GAMM|nr:hypothetical protein [Rouxiella silvae]ORJ21151.1 hypothetical protein BS639_11010 [Rouxiella silvae]
MSNLPLVLSLTGPILVLIGWKVVFYNARRIATRSESKSIVDSLVKVINEINDVSVDYWVPKTSDEFQKYLLTVSAKSSQFQHYVNVLSNRGVKLDVALLSVIADDATLDAEYASAMTDEERIQKAHLVVESSMSGLRHIFSCFENAYPPVTEIEMYEYFSWCDDAHKNHSSSKVEITV